MLFYRLMCNSDPVPPNPLPPLFFIFPLLPFLDFSQFHPPPPLLLYLPFPLLTL